jgi:hypothetical protein
MSTRPCEAPSKSDTATDFFVHVVLPIGVGAGIYLGWRSTNLLVFQWLDTVGLTSWIPRPQIALPRWVLYALPDACWAYAATSWMLLIWKQFVPWVYAGVSLAVLSEFGQLIGLVPGVYSHMDVGFYITAFLLAGACNAKARLVNVRYYHNGHIGLR